MSGHILPQIISLSLWLGVLVLVFVPLERLFAAHPREALRKGVWTDLAYYYLSSLVPVALLSVPSGVLAWASHALVPEAVLQTTGAWPFPVRILASLVLGDVGYYWSHRLSHRVPFLWDFHSIHHAPEEVDFLINSHAHPFDMVFGRFCGMIPIFALGLAGNIHAPEYQVPFLASAFALVWGFFIHANLRWRFGPLEWIISTPAFHHWHHTRSGPINRNFAATFPLIDWIFGTAHLPGEFPADYGIKGEVPEGLLGQLVHPLISSTSMGGPSSPPDDGFERPANAGEPTTLDLPPLASPPDGAVAAAVATGYGLGLEPADGE